MRKTRDGMKQGDGWMYPYPNVGPLWEIPIFHGFFLMVDFLSLQNWVVNVIPQGFFFSLL